MYLLVYTHLSPRNVLIAGTAISIFLLIGAHLFEHLGGLDPCLLCLEQREVHWVIATVGILSFAASMFLKSEKVLAAGLGAMAAAFVFSTWLSGFHAGVEWGFWPGPQACSAGSAQPGAISGDDILKTLNAPGPQGPSCNEAAWRLFGISMAGYNALISFVFAVLTSIACFAAWRMKFLRTTPQEALS